MLEYSTRLCAVDLRRARDRHSLFSVLGAALILNVDQAMSDVVGLPDERLKLGPGPDIRAFQLFAGRNRRGTVDP